jgi:hypothetical protein
VQEKLVRELSATSFADLMLGRNGRKASAALIQ